MQGMGAAKMREFMGGGGFPLPFHAHCTWTRAPIFLPPPMLLCNTALPSLLPCRLFSTPLPPPLQAPLHCLTSLLTPRHTAWSSAPPQRWPMPPTSSAASSWQGGCSRWGGGDSQGGCIR